ncbi:MAG TPA: neprosin family prolyl endopeptidase [Solirubrobacterales bacterium]|nr:neprosin family prolyl endopeptidase [Solirubrobacterales bacterium]
MAVAVLSSAALSACTATGALAAPPTKVKVDGETYRCVERTPAQSVSLQPPPVHPGQRSAAADARHLPLLQPPETATRLPGVESEAATICPPGQLPAPRELGEPDHSGPPSLEEGPSASEDVPAASPQLADSGHSVFTSGPIHFGGYNYWYAAKGRTVSGEHVTALEGYASFQQSEVDSEFQTGHSITQLWAASNEAPGGEFSTVEFGTSRLRSSSFDTRSPYLFVGHFDEGTWKDNTGFVQVSNKVGHVIGYPVDENAGPLFTVGPEHLLQIYEEGTTGKWIVALDEDVVGYFPVTAWIGNDPPIYLTVEEVGGEVAAFGTNTSPQTTMGDAEFGSSENSAYWAGLRDKSNGVTRWVNTNEQVENEPGAYNLGSGGSFPNGGPAGSNFRYGGPGWCGGTIGVACPRVVTTQEASAATGSSVTLHGTVSPQGDGGEYYFEYGPRAEEGHTQSWTRSDNDGFNTGTWGQVAAEKTIKGLKPGTTYAFRLTTIFEGGEKHHGETEEVTVGWDTKPSGNPSPSYNNLDSVSCTSSTFCLGAGVGGLTETWNGTSWTAQSGGTAVKVPAEATSVELNDVSCTSPEACLAVGFYGTKVGSKNLAEFWNGKEWTLNLPISPSEHSYLTGVSCAAAKECITVGFYDTTVEGVEVTKTYAQRWNGTAWFSQQTWDPATPGGTPKYEDSYLSDVSCTSPTLCTAVGFHNAYLSTGTRYEPFYERWNGSGSWKGALLASPNPGTNTDGWLEGISCSSETNCMAAGYTANGHSDVSVWKPMVERLSGTTWSAEEPKPAKAGKNAYLYDVSCASASECLAVGESTQASLTTMGSKTLVERWNGSGWERQAPANPTDQVPYSSYLRLNGVSCTSLGICEAVGFYKKADGNFATFASGYRDISPTPVTKPASAVSDTAATLNGTVNPNRLQSKYAFEYGPTSSYGTATSTSLVGSGEAATGTTPIAVNRAITGLSPSTTYHYRVVASNENPETKYGEDATFTTTGPPIVTAEAGVPNPKNGTEATLNAFVNPSGYSTTYQFEYGTSPGVYTGKAPASPESIGTTAKAVNQTIAGLFRGITYYFRVTATNSAGTTHGAEGSFTMQSSPGVETLEAVEVSKSGATLKGTVSPHGEETKYFFQYGTSEKYGSSAPAVAATLPASTLTVPISVAATSLSPSTTYHYRLVAENQFGSTVGKDKTFVTLAGPTIKAKGAALKVGAPLKWFSSNLAFTGGYKPHSCAENEFTGAVAVNPGVTASVAGGRMQAAGGGEKCTTPEGFQYQSAITTKSATADFSFSKAEFGTFSIKGILVKQSIYALGVLGRVCEYNLDLSGSYTLKKPLEKVSATGTATLVGGYANCNTSEAATGEFTITSEGFVVEVTS